MEKVAFELFGLELLEPLSTLMNWVLAAQSYIFYKRLSGCDTPFQKSWRWFFLAYAAAFVFGGFTHLLYNYTGQYFKITNWGLAIVGVVAAELAMVLDVEDPKKKQMFTTVIRAKVFATFAMLVFDFSFKWVMIHSAGFFILTGILSYGRFKAGEHSYKYFLYGIACLLAIGIAKIGQVDIHPAWFNRDDVAHVIMLVMYWMFYKGVKGYQGSSLNSNTPTIDQNPREA